MCTTCVSGAHRGPQKNSSPFSSFALGFLFLLSDLLWQHGLLEAPLVYWLKFQFLGTHFPTMDSNTAAIINIQLIFIWALEHFMQYWLVSSSLSSNWAPETPHLEAQKAQQKGRVLRANDWSVAKEALDSGRHENQAKADTRIAEMEQRVVHSLNSRGKDQLGLHIKMGLESHRAGASMTAEK